jgi:hypothetical protein
MTEQLSHTEVDGKEITVLDMPLDTLGTFATRSIRAMEAAKLTTVRDVVKLTEQEFQAIPGIGAAARMDMKYRLYVKGLAFRDPDKEGHPPLPFPSMHERLARIEQRLDKLEGLPLLREVGDMSGHRKDSA